ncbi:hypothetical protein [Taklimakanibacter lacteus]|uniref:hypothetical protein n=1 Tax=Taklimakanibacter lacteus TaxID=2268456 RepID=UPI0013C403D6
MRALVLLICVMTAITSPGLAEAAGKSKRQPDMSAGPAMRFVIVRSHVNGCEPNCPQWISAEGVITAQTPSLLRKALKQAGGSQLPILMTSPGGDVEAALALGEIIRTRKLDVGVGWTFFAGCWPGDRTCNVTARQKGRYYGTPFAWRAYCLAACLLAITGGRKRLAAGASLGTTEFSTPMTDQRITYQERYRIVKGKKKVLSRKVIKRETLRSYTTSKLDKASWKKLRAYAGKMGVGNGYLALFTKARPGSVYFVSGEEALFTGLITSLDSARSLVANQLCKMTPAAKNCVRHVGAEKS